jgi:hypothetical protein
VLCTGTTPGSGAVDLLKTFVHSSPQRGATQRLVQHRTGEHTMEPGSSDRGQGRAAIKVPVGRGWSGCVRGQAQELFFHSSWHWRGVQLDACVLAALWNRDDSWRRYLTVCYRGFITQCGSLLAGLCQRAHSAEPVTVVRSLVSPLWISQGPSRGAECQQIVRS